MIQTTVDRVVKTAKIKTASIVIHYAANSRPTVTDASMHKVAIIVPATQLATIPTCIAVPTRFLPARAHPIT